MGELPFVDEHTTVVEAAPEATWDALVARRSGSDGLPAAVARTLGCEQTRTSGPSGAVGSTVPGFRVVRADRPRELALEGRHHFSRYALTFRVEDLSGHRSRLRAETRAEFPGLRGRLYRALVIGSRGHVLATRRMLGAAGRRAESARMGR